MVDEALLLRVSEVVAGRYEVLRTIGATPTDALFVARDRSTRQVVTLKLALAGAAATERCRQEARLARAVSHPNVCRVHDLVECRIGPVVVMGGADGELLSDAIVRLRPRGGHDAAAFRSIAGDLCAGLAAIHGSGRVHGDVRPEHVLVSGGRAALFGLGGTEDGPVFAAPESTFEDTRTPATDVHALGHTLFRLCLTEPAPADFDPRKVPLKAMQLHPLVGVLANDELKQVFRTLDPDPRLRPHARRMRFLQAAQYTPSLMGPPRDLIHPGAPPSREQPEFRPGLQSLLVTYSTHAPELVGELLPLDRPLVQLGRAADQDIVLPDPTVSSAHAKMLWQEGGKWLFADAGSTNGCYVDHEYERVSDCVLRHGGEVQLGELRLMLVGFGPGSRAHRHARRFLGRRDALTALFLRSALVREIEADAAFAAWADLPMQLASYWLERPAGEEASSTMVALLALRTAARRVVDMTEGLLLSIWPLAAGRTEARWSFVVAMVGTNEGQARAMAEAVISSVQGLLPHRFVLRAELRPFVG